MAVAVGERAAGRHIEAPRMAEELLGSPLRRPRRRPRPDLPDHRERDRRVGRRWPSLRLGVGAQRMLRSPAQRCRSRRATSTCCPTRSDRWGAETFIMFLLQAALREPHRLRRRGARACQGGLHDAAKQAAGRVGDRRGLRAAVIAALDDDFRTPEALRCSPPRRPAPRHRRGGAGGARPGCLAHDELAAADVVALAEERRSARARRDFAESTGCATSWPGAGGRRATPATRSSSIPRDG